MRSIRSLGLKLAAALVALGSVQFAPALAAQGGGDAQPPAGNPPTADLSVQGPTSGTVDSATGTCARDDGSDQINESVTNFAAGTDGSTGVRVEYTGVIMTPDGET